MHAQYINIHSPQALTHMCTHTNSQLEKEVKKLQTAVEKEQSVSKSKEQLLKQINELKQESDVAIQAALEQYKLDLRAQQEQHKSILLQSRGLSGLNLVSDDYHKGPLHLVIRHSYIHPRHTHTHTLYICTTQIIRAMHNDILDFLLGRR